MARVSYRQLENLAGVTNRMLERAGSRARIVAGARYDYHALDLTTIEDMERGHGGMVKTLAIGRTGELAQYLWALQEGIYLLSEPYSADRSS